nr:hypothetical protein [Aquibium carbonis]
MTGYTLEAVAHRSLRHPIAAHGAGAHAVLRLLRVLLALMLRNRGEQILDQDGVGIFAELNRGAFELATGFAKNIAQIPMAANVAREAADIIDDDDAAFGAKLLEMLDHRREGWPRGASARHVFGEYLIDDVTLELRILPAARFLAAQSITFAHLLRAGHAAIDQGFLSFRGVHDSALLFPAFPASAPFERGRQGSVS